MRIVTRIPTEEFQNDLGIVFHLLRRNLSDEDIAQLLRERAIKFAVADVGLELRWIPTEDRFRFWKDEAKPHLSIGKPAISPEAFPGSYCYVASEWKNADSANVAVLLEKHH